MLALVYLSLPNNHWLYEKLFIGRLIQVVLSHFLVIISLHSIVVFHSSVNQTKLCLVLSFVCALLLSRKLAVLISLLRSWTADFYMLAKHSKCCKALTPLPTGIARNLVPVLWNSQQMRLGWHLSFSGSYVLHGLLDPACAKGFYHRNCMTEKLVIRIW